MRIARTPESSTSSCNQWRTMIHQKQGRTAASLADTQDSNARADRTLQGRRGSGVVRSGPGRAALGEQNHGVVVAHLERVLRRRARVARSKVGKCSSCTRSRDRRTHNSRDAALITEGQSPYFALNAVETRIPSAFSSLGVAHLKRSCVCEFTFTFFLSVK